VTWSRAEKTLLRHDKSVHVSRFSLLRYVDVRRLVGGQVLGQVADAALSVIMASHLLLTRSEGPTNTRLMHMVVATALPLLVAGPIAGFLSDRFSRRTILVSGQLFRVFLALTLLTLLYLQRSEVAIALWALGLCANRVLYNARIASIRHVVRDHELVAANSLSLMLSSVSGVIGASIAVVTLRFMGPASVSIVILGHATAMVTWCRIRAILGGGAEHEHVRWYAVVEQFRHSKTRYSMLATSAHRLIFGGILATTALRVDSLATGTTIAFGSVIACNGFGSFLGTLSAEWVNEHLHRKPLTVATFAITSVFTGVSCAFDDRYFYLANVILVAFLFQNLRLCTDATIQSNARRGAGGRTFAAYDLSYNLAFLVGILFALSFESNVGGVTVLTSCAFMAFIGGVGLFLLRRADNLDLGGFRDGMAPEILPETRGLQADNVLP
jgi:MFS family permease